MGKDESSRPYVCHFKGKQRWSIKTGARLAGQILSMLVDSSGSLSLIAADSSKCLNYFICRAFQRQKAVEWWTRFDTHCRLLTCLDPRPHPLGDDSNGKTAPSLTLLLKIDRKEWNDRLRDIDIFPIPDLLLWVFEGEEIKRKRTWQNCCLLKTFIFPFIFYLFFEYREEIKRTNEIVLHQGSFGKSGWARAVEMRSMLVSRCVYSNSILARK